MDQRGECGTVEKGDRRQTRRSLLSAKRAGLRVLEGVFAFLQLGDVELRLGAVQPFEPQLVIVDVGDDGAETNTTVV